MKGKFKPETRIMIAISLCAVFSTGIGAVTIRHDVKDAAYIAFAKKEYLRPGLVTTRPMAEVPGSGVIIHPNYVLTAGHVGSVNGPAKMPVVFDGKEYMVDFVYLCPGYALNKSSLQGNDISLLKIEGNGITRVRPAVIWTGGMSPGMRIIGVGQGKTGTGLQNDEPGPPRTFRAYENTVDYILGADNYRFFITDFDSPDANANTLAGIVYALGGKKITTLSSAMPLPLEGSTAAGDSGSGVWIESGGSYFLAGITSGRFYSCYGGQSGYVNLGDERILAWIKSICPGVKTAR